MICGRVLKTNRKSNQTTLRQKTVTKRLVFDLVQRVYTKAVDFADYFGLQPFPYGAKII